MNILNTILVFAVAFLSVFGEAALPVPQAGEVLHRLRP